MIFAAGLGTRLGPITRSMPKALVPVAGVPMIERVARRLIGAGADRLIINTHHFAEQVMRAVTESGGYGAEVVFSHEPDGPLETGGGLRRAAVHFRGHEPIFIHNVDVLTNAPLEEIYAAHGRGDAIATLATMERQTSRYLLFDDAGLFGRVDERRGVRIEVRVPEGEVRRLAFAGIHVISASLPGLITEEGVFSILDPYLRLAGEGRRIDAFRIDGYSWIDVGKPDQLQAAGKVVEG